MGSSGRALLLLTFTLHFTRLFCVNFNGTFQQGQIFKRGDSLVSKSRNCTLDCAPSYGPDSDKFFLRLRSTVGVIWVANRNNAINIDSLIIDDYGNLKLLYDGNSQSMAVYSSGSAQNINARVILHNNCNMILYEMNVNGSIKRILWQSFDYPIDILLSGMRLGINWKTGQKWTLTSQQYGPTYAVGPFAFGMDPNNTKQLVIWRQGNIYWTSGPQNEYGSFPNLSLAPPGQYSDHFRYVSNENGTYFYFFSTPNSHYLVDEIDASIILKVNGRLSGLVSISCFESPPDDASNGCVPLKPPDCKNSDARVSLPYSFSGNMSQEGYVSADVGNISLHDCSILCLNNCSCAAYAPVNIDLTGCKMWSREANFLSNPYVEKIYFINVTDTTTIMNPPDNPPDYPPVNIIKRDSKAKLTKLLIISIIGGTLAMLISWYICYALWRKRTLKARTRLERKKLLHEIRADAIPSLINGEGNNIGKSGKLISDIQVFSFVSIVKATSNFSSSNYLGKGGFGPVYKGTLCGGQEIAIKRLAGSSRQGLTEFKNEVKLIAKLQHNNLVKLYGFCIEREERMLIYEYMPNKSLDFHLFESELYGLDSNEGITLDWITRFGIIQGIVQALVYLHKYSRLKIIHRDLKPSNILLDSKMNPKISDFGMAKLFRLDESELNTNIIAGTRGYMAPEYFLHGTVSTKIDVFSFGVLLLEIISGKKNGSCFHFDYALTLSGYAWQFWNEGRASQLIDPKLNETCNVNEILKCIHIGLLCVQDQAKDRPTIQEVVSFMSNEAVLLPEPKQPAFFINMALREPVLSHNELDVHSFNDVTISTMEARS